MDLLERFQVILFKGQEPLTLSWLDSQIKFFVLRTEVLGAAPKILKISASPVKNTYQIGQVQFLDGEGYCLKQQYIEQSKMNFGFWTVASGLPTEKIQHYDDSIERLGRGNKACFANTLLPPEFWVELPFTRTSTSYSKEAVGIVDELIPGDVEDVACIVESKVLCYDPEHRGCIVDTSHLEYYPPSIDVEVKHHDNGFTRYFDPRKHGNGQWASGVIVELFPDAGDVALKVVVDLYVGM